ncbi:hypothetical protein [Calothrix sp. NIES-3974]|uniref:hypothetical protein n=1 Tax=Calothrix sp. NIES-3974 TaxID=2005462 RepID=UPI000B60B4FF|nr:hypothetical protein [Calothrix sp. NIES-3974]BAZ03476.1 hypothetical protein NIES3974_01020 [Calothrix sp. NIES-3974]
MNYTFDIVGISPVLNFFDHQLKNQQNHQKAGIEYVGSPVCTLDALLAYLEPIPSKWGWDEDEIMNTVINFWMNNSESIRYWKLRLEDAGKDNLLVARLADIHALKHEFELLLEKKI